MIDYSFLESRKSDLIEIYKKERFMNNNGQEGALMLDYRKDNNVDVYFWTLENMVESIREKFLEEFRKNNDKNNMAYVILLDNQTVEVRGYQL
jgi:hypothetical protein